MGQQTRIDWADSTWNPVTGCLHDCEYCYARRIAERFGGHTCDEDGNPVGVACAIGVQSLDKPKLNLQNGMLRNAPYPWGFLPTFHRYRLGEPIRWTKPRTIFVCSMADLFGAWVPESWIMEVFSACAKAPQHRYMFLTKNPARLLELGKAGKLPTDRNMWYGTTTTRPDQEHFYSRYHNYFASIEPIHESFEHLGMDEMLKWIIIGAETGNRKGKIIPEKEWIRGFATGAKNECIPVFMKESLRGIMGDDFRQEFPWEEHDG